MKEEMIVCRTVSLHLTASGRKEQNHRPLLLSGVSWHDLLVCMALARALDTSFLTRRNGTGNVPCEGHSWHIPEHTVLARMSNGHFSVYDIIPSTPSHYGKRLTGRTSPTAGPCTDVRRLRPHVSPVTLCAGYLSDPSILCTCSLSNLPVFQHCLFFMNTFNGRTEC